MIIASKSPAILGGDPVFPSPVYVVKPLLPDLSAVHARLSVAFETARLANDSQFAREFEELVRRRLGVRNCVALCNGTLSLVLALKGLGIRGKVIVPSFTFCATVHALDWAGLEPVFADIDPRTLNLTPETIQEALSPDVSAVMPVMVFGSPCEVLRMQVFAKDHGLKLLFDSAQAFGSEYDGRPLGTFGDAEVFSLHATKVLPVGEGGMVTTDNDELADYLRRVRNFGLTGDQDSTEMGINAKMAEFPAIMGIEGLKDLDEALAHRRVLADDYLRGLADVPGLSFQTHLPEARTNYQNLAVLIDEPAFGLSRDELAKAMEAENIFCRKYFSPPVHRMSSYAHLLPQYDEKLPVTNRVADSVLCLPMYSSMPRETVERICDAITEIHRFSPEIRRAAGELACKAA